MRTGTTCPSQVLKPLDRPILPGLATSLHTGWTGGVIESEKCMRHRCDIKCTTWNRPSKQRRTAKIKSTETYSRGYYIQLSKKQPATLINGRYWILVIITSASIARYANDHQVRCAYSYLQQCIDLQRCVLPCMHCRFINTCACMLINYQGAFRTTSMQLSWIAPFRSINKQTIISDISKYSKMGDLDTHI